MQTTNNHSNGLPQCQSLYMFCPGIIPACKLDQSCLWLRSVWCECICQHERCTVHYMSCRSHKQDWPPVSPISTHNFFYQSIRMRGRTASVTLPEGNTAKLQSVELSYKSISSATEQLCLLQSMCGLSGVFLKHRGHSLSIERLWQTAVAAWQHAISILLASCLKRQTFFVVLCSVAFGRIEGICCPLTSISFHQSKGGRLRWGSRLSTLTSKQSHLWWYRCYSLEPPTKNQWIQIIRNTQQCYIKKSHNFSLPFIPWGEQALHRLTAQPHLYCTASGLLSHRKKLLYSMRPSPSFTDMELFQNGGGTKAFSAELSRGSLTKVPCNVCKHHQLVHLLLAQWLATSPQSKCVPQGIFFNPFNLGGEISIALPLQRYKWHSVLSKTCFFLD